MRNFFVFLCRELEWATAHFSSLSHDTIDCIVTQGSRGVQQGATIRPGALRHGPMTRPARAMIRPAHTQGSAASRARDLAIG